MNVNVHQAQVLVIAKLQLRRCNIRNVPSDFSLATRGYTLHVPCRTSSACDPASTTSPYHIAFAKNSFLRPHVRHIGIDRDYVTYAISFL